MLEVYIAEARVLLCSRDRPGPPGPPPPGREHLVWQQDPPAWVLPPDMKRPKGRRAKAEENVSSVIKDGLDLDSVFNVMTQKFYDMWRDPETNPRNLSVEDATKVWRSHFGSVDPQEHFSRTLANAQVNVLMNWSSLMSILKDGRFKSSMESGKTSTRTDAAKRYLMESQIFGYTEVMKERPELYPKYGFLSDRGQMTDVGRSHQYYGSIKVNLKDAVKAQSTLTLDDSLDANAYRPYPIGQVPPVAMGSPDVNRAFISMGWRSADTAFETDDSFAKARRDAIRKYVETGTVADLVSAVPRSAYAEVQMFGEVSTDMIESIAVSSRQQASKLRTILDQAGHSDVKIEGFVRDDRLDSVWNGDYVELNPADIEALPPEYVQQAGMATLMKYGRQLPSHIQEDLKAKGLSMPMSRTEQDGRHVDAFREMLTQIWDYMQGEGRTDPNMRGWRAKKSMMGFMKDLMPTVPFRTE